MIKFRSCPIKHTLPTHNIYIYISVPFELMGKGFLGSKNRSWIIESILAFQRVGHQTFLSISLPNKGLQSSLPFGFLHGSLDPRHKKA